jgi:hypothetical protein
MGDVDEDVDHADGVIFHDVIIESFGEQRAPGSIFACIETLHAGRGGATTG